MPKSNKHKVIKSVFDFFIKSKDFNGITLTDLSSRTNINYQQLLLIIKELVLEDIVSIQSDLSPHIIRTHHYDKEKQIQLLKEAKNNKVTIINEIKVPSPKKTKIIRITSDSHLICAYPTESYLKQNRNVDEFREKPYSQRLALGEPHLTPVFFELNVLERYSTDPRYDFRFYDYSGHISIKSTKNETLLRENDRVFLDTFGLGFDKKGNRIVVAYLRYLNDLTPHHQSYWKSKEVTGLCKGVKEYYDNTILGKWVFANSVFTAFLKEQKIVNELSNLIFEKQLFLKTFADENRPKEFTFFLSPTLENYNKFIFLLDKMISDNINKKFFENIDHYNYEDVANGVVERKTKGTLQLLEEWLKKNIHLKNEKGYDILINSFKKVRKERQSPAHKIQENIYDKDFHTKQMEMMKEVYFSMQGLRIILKQHPLASEYKIEKWIEEGRPRIY